MNRAASIEDLRLLGKRRLPRFVFDFIDGGAESETNLERNRSALNRIQLIPRYLIDVHDVSTDTNIFGRSYSVPFGVAPMGFMNMAWPGTDLAIARLAARERMAMVASAAASTPLEQIAEAAEGYCWFQIYVASDQSITDDLLTRAKAVGCEVLFVTVDVPHAGKRDRDIRNAFQIPFKLTPGIIAGLASHPRWSLGTLKNGPPSFANFRHHFEGSGKPMPLVEFTKRISSSSFDWDDLRRLRDKWNGVLILKGVLHEDDAAHAAAAGCDGIVVSNHGGRQADYGPTSIDVLPRIAREIDGKIPVLFDSGVRRGADVLRAKALGADFVLAGRAFAYGAAAGGEQGSTRAFEILQMELTRALGQLGQQRFDDVGADTLFRHVERD